MMKPRGNGQTRYCETFGVVTLQNWLAVETSKVHLKSLWISQKIPQCCFFAGSTGMVCHSISRMNTLGRKLYGIGGNSC